MFICSIILLLITVLLLAGSLLLKAIVLVLIFEIFSPYLEVTVSSLCIEICNASSESTTITLSSMNYSVVLSLYLDILISFISSFLHSVII